MLTYYFADAWYRIKDLYWNPWMPCLLGEKSQLVEVLGVPCLVQLCSTMIQMLRNLYSNIPQQVEQKKWVYP